MESKKRVVHKIHFKAYPGGIEVLIPEIINGLKQYHFRCFVIRPPAGPNIYDNEDISVTYGSQNKLKAYFKFIKYVRNYKNDIFHVYNLGPFF